MTKEPFQRVEELFRAAVHLEASRRAEFLQEACAGNVQLQAKVERLLAEDAAPHGALRTDAIGRIVQLEAGRALNDAAGTASQGRNSVEDVPDDRLPKQIGKYTIVRAIGRGGMGVVYEAVQDRPCRTVALKVLRHGIAMGSSLRRFEYESQVLAQLRHSGIAQVYEAGTHRDDGGIVPYFAMEYMAGARSLTDYAHDTELTARARLALFASVCIAVHHGHQKGIIHRDLKPSNILVGPDGESKIIDFGVARSTDSDLAITTMQTDLGALVGTLQYMSPEQCDADPHNIDIRSDVYALGVVLYELLCGRLPYDITRVAIHEATRIIREEQPARLSTVNKTLRGDVDTIVLKALEKERDQRYASALELAEDIRRYLNDEPLTARPPSAAYRMRKFVRRNRVLVGGTAAVLLALVAGLVASTLFAIKTGRAERDSRQHQYVANIKAAEYALSLNDVAAAERQLDDAPSDERNWEWRYLRSAIDTSLLALEGHDEPVFVVAFSEDGARLVSVAEDGTVCIWDIATGSELRRRRYGNGVAQVSALSHDGSLVAIAVDDETVSVWDTSAEDAPVDLPVRTLHTCTEEGIAFSPDNSRLAVGSPTGLITLWSIPEGEQVGVLKGHHGRVGSLAFSPDGSQLASGGFHERDMTVRVWSVSAGEELGRMDGHRGGIYAVAFGPDGTRLASASQDNTVRLWDLVERVEITESLTHADDVISVAFSPDGNRLATATARGTVGVWSATNGNRLTVLRGHQDYVRSLAFGPDGALLASASGDRSVRVWDGSGDGAKLVLRGHSQSVSAVAFAPDGQYLASAAGDGRVAVWDLTTRELVATHRIVDHSAFQIRLSPDGCLAAWAQGDNAVHLWNWCEDRILPPIEGHTDAVGHVEFSPDGAHLASASADDTVRLWSVPAGQELATLTGHTDRVLSAEFSPNGRQVVTASADQTVRLWSVRDGSEKWRGKGGKGGHAVFTHDGTAVISFGGSAPVTLRDAATGEELQVLADTQRSAVAVSPNGTRFASILPDRDLHLLDARTGQELLHLRGHDSERVRAIAFSPDGTRVASGGHDQTVQIWDTVPYRLRLVQRKAVLVADKGDFDEAERLYRQALHGLCDVLGTSHPGTLSARKGLVESLIAQDKFREGNSSATCNAWRLKCECTCALGG